MGVLGRFAYNSINDNKDGKNIEIPTIISAKGVELYGNKDYVFVDVRTINEHVAKAIPNTPVIPIQELESRIDELKKYKDKKIVVYCRSGNRSRTGTDILLKHGYNAVNLAGGMKKWKGPVISGE
jgi:rhodanese-related sulfurtransferase